MFEDWGEFRRFSGTRVVEQRGRVSGDLIGRRKNYRWLSEAEGEIVIRGRVARLLGFSPHGHASFLADGRGNVTRLFLGFSARRKELLTKNAGTELLNLRAAPIY